MGEIPMKDQSLSDVIERLDSLQRVNTKLARDLRRLRRFGAAVLCGMLVVFAAGLLPRDPMAVPRLGHRSAIRTAARKGEDGAARGVNITRIVGFTSRRSRRPPQRIGFGRLRRRGNFLVIDGKRFP